MADFFFFFCPVIQKTKKMKKKKKECHDRGIKVYHFLPETVSERQGFLTQIVVISLISEHGFRSIYLTHGIAHRVTFLYPPKLLFGKGLESSSGEPQEKYGASLP